MNPTPTNSQNGATTGLALDACSLPVSRADALKKERDEWRTKHWNAHHHAHQMFLEVVRLRAAMGKIDSAIEAHLAGLEVDMKRHAERATDRAFNGRVRHINQGYALGMKDCIFRLRRLVARENKRQPRENA